MRGGRRPRASASTSRSACWPAVRWCARCASRRWWCPSIVFPLILLSINSSGLDSATDLPGFPTDSYFDFALAIAFVQGALFSANSAGTNVASDIETGFLEPARAHAAAKLALMMGQLAGILALGLIQAVTFLPWGWCSARASRPGWAAPLLIVALSLVISLAFGSIGAFAALRSGSGEAVQGVFPLFFAALFLSSMALPRDLIENDWFQTVATYNPVSYMLEGIRSLVISGWDAEAIALGFACAGGVAAGGAPGGLLGAADADGAHMSRSGFYVGGAGGGLAQHPQLLHQPGVRDPRR